MGTLETTIYLRVEFKNLSRYGMSFREYGILLVHDRTCPSVQRAASSIAILSIRCAAISFCVTVVVVVVVVVIVADRQALYHSKKVTQHGPEKDER